MRSLRLLLGIIALAALTLADESWTLAPKRILYVRVSFPDFPADPISRDSLLTRAQTASDWLRQMSFGQTWLEPDVTTQVFRLTTNAASYATRDAYMELHTIATNLAQQAGYNLANYHILGVAFTKLSGISNSKFTFGGRGIDTRQWLNGSFAPGTIVHEIGHNLGINHANAWVLNSEGAHQTYEYGDPFDRMGQLPDGPDPHFNLYLKHWLGWIKNHDLQHPTVSGDFVIYPMDQAEKMFPVGLRIPYSAERDLWLSFRERQIRPEIGPGLSAHFGDHVTKHSQLIDLTPGSVLDWTPGTTNDHRDAILQAGAAHRFTETGLRIETVRRELDSANQPRLRLRLAFTNNVRFVSAFFPADESSGRAIVSVERRFNSGGPVSVRLRTSPATALSTLDFTPTDVVLHWKETELGLRQVSIPVVADSQTEGSESFSVTLSEVDNAVIGPETTAEVRVLEPGTVRDDFVADPIRFGGNFFGLHVQPDERILIGGWVQYVYARRFASSNLARLLPNGRVDTTFHPPSIGPGRVWSIATQPDGKILIGGDFTHVDGAPAGYFARLLSDGARDESFQMGSGANSRVEAISVNAAGIYLGGSFATIQGVNSPALSRLTPSGERDASFSSPFTSGATSQILPIKDHLLVAGRFNLNGDCSLARISFHGAVDPVFQRPRATRVSNSTEVPAFIFAVAVQDDGRILVGGNFTSIHGKTANRVARLLPDGSFDESFNCGPGPNSDVLSLLAQPNGKAVISGTFTTVAGTPRGRIARLNNNGTLDHSFLSGVGADRDVNRLAVSGDSILALGWFNNFNNQPAPWILRLNSGLSAFDAWRQQAFSPSPFWGSDAVTETFPDSDPDNDLLPNWLEHISGANPLLPNPPAQRLSVAHKTNSAPPRMKFGPWPAGEPPTRVHVSEDLQIWSVIPSLTKRQIIQKDGHYTEYDLPPIARSTFLKMEVLPSQ